MNVPDDFLWHIQKDFRSLLSSFGQSDLTKFIRSQFHIFVGIKRFAEYVMKSYSDRKNFLEQTIFRLTNSLPI